MEMRGKMIEADFEKDELIFHMAGNYQAAAGLYVIMPVEEFHRRFKERSNEEFLEIYRKDG